MLEGIKLWAQHKDDPFRPSVLLHPRLFDISQIDKFASIAGGSLFADFRSPAGMILYNSRRHDIQSRAVRLTDGSFSFRTFSMVIAVNGACRNNRHPAARASYSVHFDSNSFRNLKGFLPHLEHQTNQAAVIYAATEALEAAAFHVQVTSTSDEHLHLIILRTDSAYLVNSISQHICKWVNYG
jgi:hypothetical protein